MVLINNRGFDMTFKGLFIDVNPIYIKGVLSLSKSGLEMLVLAQFIVTNQDNKLGHKEINLTWDVVKRLSMSLGSKMSKRAYTLGIKDLLEFNLLVHKGEDVYELNECMDYLYMSDEGLIDG